MGPLCELLGQPSSQQKIHLDENEHSSVLQNVAYYTLFCYKVCPFSLGTYSNTTMSEGQVRPRVIKQLLRMVFETNLCIGLFQLCWFCADLLVIANCFLCQ